MGLAGPHEISPGQLFRRANDMRVKTFAEVYDFLRPGQLLDGEGLSEVWRRDWEAA